ncbi:hypothetical protein Tco_1327185 [Tanacetum coccineum]
MPKKRVAWSSSWQKPKPLFTYRPKKDVETAEKEKKSKKTIFVMIVEVMTTLELSWGGSGCNRLCFARILVVNDGSMVPCGCPGEPMMALVSPPRIDKKREMVVIA